MLFLVRVLGRSKYFPVKNFSFVGVFDCLLVSNVRRQRAPGDLKLVRLFSLEFVQNFFFLQRFDKVLSSDR